jgi:tRNA A37 threonylcarbamoyladenosine synthetase subunit TsaC/SUA5/YrdC
LKNQEIIAVPTDMIYGLIGDLFLEIAVEKACGLKK